jgi:hypothetical protein
MSNRLGIPGVLRRTTIVLGAAALATAVTLAAGTTIAAGESGPASMATPQDSSTWIDYRIGGDATEEHREPDIVMCSEIGDGEFSLHSMGEWVITIETPAPTVGEHEGKFLVAPPQGKFQDGDARTEDRAKGTGTITLEDGGKGSMGMPILKGTFSAPELAADSGYKFTLEGSFSCLMF